MSLRVFCLAVPHASGAIHADATVDGVYPVANGKIDAEEPVGELVPFVVSDVEFKDGSVGHSIAWMNARSTDRSYDLLPLDTLVKAWVHGAVSPLPDETSFWASVVEDLVNTVVELTPGRYFTGELTRAVWDTLRTRLGICLTDAAEHNHPERSH